MMPNDRQLDRLFERYQKACPDVEASATFMPGVWQRIDARRGFVAKLGAYARVLAMAAASLCLAVGLFEISPYGPDKQLTANNYVEVLDEDHDADSLAVIDTIPETETVR